MNVKPSTLACTKCGIPLVPSAQFCHKCGSQHAGREGTEPAGNLYSLNTGSYVYSPEYQEALEKLTRAKIHWVGWLVALVVGIFNIFHAGGWILVPVSWFGMRKAKRAIVDINGRIKQAEAAGFRRAEEIREHQTLARAIDARLGPTDGMGGMHGAE